MYTELVTGPSCIEQVASPGMSALHVCYPLHLTRQQCEINAISINKLLLPLPLETLLGNNVRVAVFSPADAFYAKHAITSAS